MFLPYASDNPPLRRPYATLTLLLVLLMLSLWVMVSDQVDRGPTSALLLSTVGIVPGAFRPITLLTYSLFHASFGHFLVNAFYLWVFGAGIEAALGRRWLIVLFFAGGAIGGLLRFLVTLILLPPALHNEPIVGASAACAGLVGLYAVRYYRATLTFVGMPLRVHVVLVVALFLLLEIGSGLWYLVAGNASDGVAHWAHIGGFIFGLSCASAMGLGDAGQRAYLSQDANNAMQLNVPGAAIRNWETLLAREPDNTAARREIARAWLVLGDKEQAAREYSRAIQTCLSRQRNSEAASLTIEGREIGMTIPTVAPNHLFTLGNVLSDLQQHELAAETWRALTIRHAHAPESEKALLQVISLYVHRLERREEAQVLLRLFLERYPDSAYRELGEELRRVADNNKRAGHAGLPYSPPGTQSGASHPLSTSPPADEAPPAPSHDALTPPA